ncbi:MAG: hypothetical protein COA39_011610 [Sulfurimonas sp.]|nr:hypothetical protein [Sulfurimonas sp.]
MSTTTRKDKLHDRAKKIVLSDNNCSISYIQRKLEIGYNRARMIIETLERNGVITSPNKNKVYK